MDGQRSTNIGIALSKVKVEYPVIRRSLMLLDPELAGLTPDTIESLQVALPNDEDKKATLGRNDPLDKLAPVGCWVMMKKGMIVIFSPNVLWWRW